jgi:hypothetical protein
MSSKKPEEMTLDELRKEEYQHAGQREYLLHLLGDKIAKKEGYGKHKGFDALYFYLIKKYHWMPSKVRSMSREDLWFILDQEFEIYGSDRREQSDSQ